jgi:ABC-type branched-subunit amino acid transport system ATPase component
MTKTLEREIGRTVRRKRRELSQIREEVENLLDYLDLLEARAKDAGKLRISHEEVKKRYT